MTPEQMAAIEELEAEIAGTEPKQDWLMFPVTQVETLIALARQTSGQAGEIRKTLIAAAAQFASYARQHRAKVPLDVTKAETNEYWERSCLAALSPNAQTEEWRTEADIADGANLVETIDPAFALLHGDIPDHDAVKADSDGWIPWAGGECPVGLLDLVDVVFRSGPGSGLYKARSLRWDHRAYKDGALGYGDIIAYKPEVAASVAPAETINPASMADGVWYCSRHESGGRPALCPIEGCPKDYGCARDHGWTLDQPSPRECQGLPPDTARQPQDLKGGDAPSISPAYDEAPGDPPGLPGAWPTDDDAIKALWAWFGHTWTGKILPEDIEGMKRAIRAAAHPPPEWRPIETAPRDGTTVMLWVRWARIGGVVPGPTFARCQHPKLGWERESHGHGRIADAIIDGWQPLPAPPSDSQGGMK